MSTLNNITDVMDAPMTARSQPAPERKRAPSHPGEIVGGILDDIGVSVRAAASAIGVSHNALANLVRGAAAVTPEMAIRLGAYMGRGGDDDDFWLRLQMDYDLWHARKKLKGEAARIKPAPREPKAA